MALLHVLLLLSANCVPAPVPPCNNFTGLYTGLRVVTTPSGAITSTPLPGSPYAHYGKGTGQMNPGNEHCTMVFGAMPNITWSGQFRGCAQLVIGEKKIQTAALMPAGDDDWRGARGPYMILSRDSMGPANFTHPSTAAPSWTRDLVVYEIAPKGFTSPNGTGRFGAGSGTFPELAERIPYLASIGINAVWLAGYCQANFHFFGIWSVYASQRPDVLDPTLGTEEEFKELISSFHKYGIKVLLDVVTHGATFGGSKEEGGANPFLTEHPEYFFHLEGETGKAVGKWQMADYNYAKPAFQEWWTSVWLRYVMDFGVDGFRLDGPNGISESSTVLASFDRVAVAAEKAGKPILIFAEETPFHFGEHDTKPSNAPHTSEFQPATPAPGSVNAGCFESIMFSCHDGGFDQGPGNYYGIRGSRAKMGFQGLLSYQIPVLFSGDELDTDAVGLPALGKGCYSGGGGPGGWLYGSQFQWAKNATGSWVPAQALKNSTKAAALDDFTHLMRIRLSESHILHADRCTARVSPVQWEASQTQQAMDNANVAVLAPAGGWEPYVRVSSDGSEAIVVVGNPLTNVSLSLSLRVNVSSFAPHQDWHDQDSLGSSTSWTLTDLWNDQVPPRVVSDSGVGYVQLDVVVRPDLVSRGGLAVLKLKLKPAVVYLV